MLAVWRATIAGVALVVAGVVLAQTVDATRWLTADGLRAAVGADEWYGPLCYVSAIVGGMFLPIPKVVLLGLGGALFGPWYGFAYAWLGQILGMTVFFVVARSGFQAVARRLVHEHVEAARRLDAHLEHRGARRHAFVSCTSLPARRSASSPPWRSRWPPETRRHPARPDSRRR